MLFEKGLFMDILEVTSCPRPNISIDIGFGIWGVGRHFIPVGLKKFLNPGKPVEMAEFFKEKTVLNHNVIFQEAVKVDVPPIKRAS